MKKHTVILPQSMPFQVYKEAVERHLSYANGVWRSVSHTKISALKRLQIRAFDII